MTHKVAHGCELLKYTQDETEQDTQDIIGLAEDRVDGKGEQYGTNQKTKGKNLRPFI